MINGVHKLSRNNNISLITDWQPDAVLEQFFIKQILIIQFDKILKQLPVKIYDRFKQILPAKQIYTQLP